MAYAEINNPVLGLAAHSSRLADPPWAEAGLRRQPADRIGARHRRSRWASLSLGLVPSRSRRSSSIRARMVAKSSAARGRFTAFPPFGSVSFWRSLDRSRAGREAEPWLCAEVRELLSLGYHLPRRDRPRGRRLASRCSRVGGPAGGAHNYIADDYCPARLGCCRGVFDEPTLWVVCRVGFDEATFLVEVAWAAAGSYCPKLSRQL